MRPDADPKYRNLKPGLYFQGVPKNNFDFKIIYILSKSYSGYPTTSFRAEWYGYTYKYWDFNSKKVHEFNEYWESLIDTLRPVKDKEIIATAKKVIAQYREQFISRTTEEIANLTI